MTAGAFSQSSILGRLHLIKTPVRAALMGGIKMRLSSDPTCQKSLTALVASAGEAGKVHPSKNDAISMLITRESPGGEEEKQT